MPAEILIVIPVLGRPRNAARVAVAARETDVAYRLLFVASPGDRQQIAAARKTGADTIVAPFDADRGDFAKKANLALEQSDEPWLFVVGDDTCFCPGWATTAIAVAEREEVGVVGTNDMANPRVTRGETATHNLVARWYAEQHGTVDSRPAMFHEGYDHNFVDDELVETARARRSWVFAAEARVPHLHPNTGDGVWDATYAKGHREMNADRVLFEQRRRLWRRLDAVAPPG